MECHGGAAVSQALNANIVHGHLPQHEDGVPMGHEDLGFEGPGQMDGDWAHDFAVHGPMSGPQMHADPMGAAVEEAAWADQFANDALAAEFLAQAPVEEGAMADDTNDWAAQFGQHDEGEKWAEDFNDDEVKVFGAEGEPLKSMEQKTAESKFYDFMNKVRSGEVTIDEERGVVEPGKGPMAVNDGEWLNEYANQGGNLEDWAAQHAAEMEDDEAEDAWAEEMRRQGEDGFDQAWGSDDDQMMEEFMRQRGANDDYAEEFLDEDGGEEWLKEYQEMTKRFGGAQDSTDYPFDPNNPYLFHDNPFEEGVQLLAAGTLSEAVLAFEAVCQKEAERVEGWQYLGTTQAENEKDNLAIRALNKARELSPANLTVHMALAVSHTNETNHSQALNSLRQWVLAHKEYEALGSVVMDTPGPDAVGEIEDNDFAREFLFVSASEHRSVCNLFNAALEINPADADLCVGLGILRNLSHEYDMAAENFQAALKLRPQDEKLWNKLGATLANGNRSQEALGAYDRALDINPGYVRAQYNLGIAHSNLGEHQIAAKQFLRAIVMQQGGVEVPDPPTRSTKEIWDVLRMTFNLMERPDLVEKTWTQDVNAFLKEFNLQDLAF